MRPSDTPALAALLPFLLLLNACAAPGGWFAPEPEPPFADPQLMVPAAAQMLGQGQARSDVQARLGPAEVVRFDSGYEVWVYRTRGARDARATPELVLLFDPSGHLAKLRARPAYGGGGG